ncbi:hypothetical protein HF882_03705 [Victivallis vadensis]|uniref:Uncharacterized protein n=1 Tax=Victivallis vadensis TaxID=172901 RepID=A0A848AXM0_9BACT|nr:hypothetical protein [Victivallis vadensis]NMD85682.1 hypothetical protein [Victivallis vadensis]
MNERTPSFLFDVFRWQEHPELEAIFNRLWNEMPKSRIRSTAEEQKRCLRLFLCNLYVSHYYEKPVAVPLKYSTFTEGRYKKLFIKRVPFLMVFRFLEAKGLMTVKKGIVTYSSSFDVDWDNTETICYPKYEKGCVTRVWPSDSLRDEFTSLADLLIVKDTDCIVMREEVADDKSDVPFPETCFSCRLRRELDFINQTLREHYFLFDSCSVGTKYPNPWYQNLNVLYDIHHQDYDNISSDTLLLREPSRTLRRFAPQIRAVFSNGSSEQGGRLYAAIQEEIGNWQSMPQQQRRTILIDNRPTVELDFDSFHISMLYALEGIQLNHDPYDTVAPREMRPIIKKLLLTVLNADSESATVQSMRNQISKLKQKELVSERELRFIRAVDRYHPDWMELIERLKEAHEPIGYYFCSGAGLMLQRLDSEVMREALLYLAGWRIPALPVHDSAIVAAHHESELRTAMSLGYRYVFGEEFTCGISRK